METSMEKEAVGLKIREKFKLEKFLGEYTPGKRPVEIIEIEDGKIVSHFKENK